MLQLHGKIFNFRASNYVLWWWKLRLLETRLYDHHLVSYAPFLLYLLLFSHSLYFSQIQQVSLRMVYHLCALEWNKKTAVDLFVIKCRCQPPLNNENQLKYTINELWCLITFSNNKTWHQNVMSMSGIISLCVFVFEGVLLLPSM